MTIPKQVGAGIGRPPRPARREWKVRVTRPHSQVALFDVQLSEYREFFLVATGECSVTITMFETSDDTYREPQTFIFAKPYGWRDDLTDEEALLQVWQSVGVQR
jgi:hypothetical protein